MTVDDEPGDVDDEYGKLLLLKGVGGDDMEEVDGEEGPPVVDDLVVEDNTELSAEDDKDDAASVGNTTAAAAAKESRKQAVTSVRRIPRCMMGRFMRFYYCLDLDSSSQVWTNCFGTTL